MKVEELKDEYSAQEEVTGSELKKRGYNVFTPKGFKIVKADTNEIVESYEFNKETGSCKRVDKK